ncbi:hypothetical protein C4569_03620 [Candidatus Parcubacteria bacterium]|nr:MAG: hypothetical protein C4569_03620 [Candidatus Parcubacteria bacterium]
MYLYLYDSFLNEQKYNSRLAKIEIRLTDLGIGGKISRLSPLKNLHDLIDDEIRSGVQTIVAVGNDKTLIEIINVAADYKVSIGYIPIGEHTKIADILGLPGEDKACDVVSARKIEKLDLGKVNGTYFLGSVKISPGPVVLECEKKYQVEIKQSVCQVNICNLRPGFLSTANTTGSHFNPQDGVLEALISIAKPTQFFSFFSAKSCYDSIFPFKKLSIKSKKSLSVHTDDQRVLKTPVDVEIIPKKINIIVGKERQF